MYCPPEGENFFHWSASHTQTPGLPERQAKTVLVRGSLKIPMLSHPQSRILRKAALRMKSLQIQGAVTRAKCGTLIGTTEPTNTA